MVKQAESGIDLDMIREAVAAYVAKEITPFAAQWDREASFPAQALKGLAELGCFGIAVPDHLGGAGLNYQALAVILEEIAAGDGATSTIISVNNCPVCSILLAWATPSSNRNGSSLWQAVRCLALFASLSRMLVRMLQRFVPERGARVITMCSMVSNNSSPQANMPMSLL